MKTKQMKNLGTAITNLQDYERGRESMRQEIVRMVEGMRLETHASEQMRRQLWGYNQALNDIKEELGTCKCGRGFSPLWKVLSSFKFPMPHCAICDNEYHRKHTACDRCLTQTNLLKIAKNRVSTATIRVCKSCHEDII